jgi:site-specific recombinase XerC
LKDLWQDVNELSYLKLKDLDFEENQISVFRMDGKKDIVAMVAKSMMNLKKFLAVRSQRYNAGIED